MEGVSSDACHGAICDNCTDSHQHQRVRVDDAYLAEQLVPWVEEKRGSRGRRFDPNAACPAVDTSDGQHSARLEYEQRHSSRHTGLPDGATNRLDRSDGLNRLRGANHYDGVESDFGRQRGAQQLEPCAGNDRRLDRCYDCSQGLHSSNIELHNSDIELYGSNVELLGRSGELPAALAVSDHQPVGGSIHQSSSHDAVLQHGDGDNHLSDHELQRCQLSDDYRRKHQLYRPVAATATAAGRSLLGLYQPVRCPRSSHRGHA